MKKAFGYICDECPARVVELASFKLAEELAQEHATDTGHNVMMTGPLKVVRPKASAVTTP